MHGYKAYITLGFLFLFNQARISAQGMLPSDTAYNGRLLFYQEGRASYYHNRFEGQKTANGERYRKKRLTAAHRHLPFNTLVKVTNKQNKKWVIVRINDRGPYSTKFIIDLSLRAAKHLRLLKPGSASVAIEEVSDTTRKWNNKLEPKDRGLK